MLDDLPEIGDEPKAFRRDIVALLPRLRRFCCALAGGRENGDDLLQATVERALASEQRFERGTRLDSWMYRIARNIRIDQARASKARGGIAATIDEIAEPIGSDGIAVVEGRSDLTAVARLFAALPQPQREVFSLVALDGLSYRDAADILEVPIGTIMSRLARARSTMESALHCQEDAAR